MARNAARQSVPLPALFLAFCVGALAMWVLSTYGPPKPAVQPVGAIAQLDGDLEPKPVVADTRPNVEPSATKTARAPALGAERVVATTGAARNLRVPIDGSDVDTWKGGFTERRANRAHEAVDILAPRNTPIHAVSDGTIAKLFVSKAGGNTIYQIDPAGQLEYYYAHLERYADGLHDGQTVSKGDIIGYVGTSGNAPPNTPHLHFGVFQLDESRRWWQGKAVDPYEVFHK
jgi:murein DD-endopeptidase MepM/ murein hydrolase activator NlpD